MFAGAGELYANNDNGRSERATEVLFDNEFGVETYTFFRDLVADGLAVNVGENPRAPTTCSSWPTPPNRQP